MLIFYGACSWRHKDVVRMLLKQSGGNIDFLMQQINTKELEACRFRDKDVIELLLEQSGGNIDFNARDRAGWTAFMNACENGHKDVVQLLLQYAKAKRIHQAANQFGFATVLKKSRTSLMNIKQRSSVTLQTHIKVWIP